LPEGEAFQKVENTLLKIEATVEELRNDEGLLAKNEGREFLTYSQNWAYGTNIWLNIGLTKGENRSVAGPDVAKRWREIIGPIPEAESINISSTLNSRSSDIRLRLTSADRQQMNEAMVDLKAILSRYPGVYDIKDSHTGARTEVELDLKTQGETLGLGLSDIARQVRQAFYGSEVQRIPRGTEDVKVMVRYPKEARTDLQTLDEMRIRTNDKREIALAAVADINFVPGYTKIDRIDRKRSVTVTADVLKGSGDPGVIVGEILRKHLPELQKKYPGFKIGIDGDMKDESDFFSSALKNFALALLVIYGLMSVAFRSYWQPTLILTAIPFGFMGAVIGHVVMGREVSMMSMLGFFACAGVVVNDNLVLLDRINTLRAEGKDVLTAVLDAGRDRFRPIVLTSITTFIGLVPILAETSTQAKFLIPMVISLSFGVLFATVVTLILVPSLYYIGERVRARFSGNPLVIAAD
jgi:multidrug efflux pump subunit AcrB